MRRLIMPARRVCRVVGACASAGRRPAGPSDHAPPEIVVRSRPIPARPTSAPRQSSSSSTKWSAIGRRRGDGARSALSHLAAHGGSADVSWHREPHHGASRASGFRPNTAYRITMLPGLADLRGNVRRTARRSSSPPARRFPPYSIPGRVFDWAAETPGERRVRRGDLARRHERRLSRGDRLDRAVRRRAAAAGDIHGARADRPEREPHRSIATRSGTRRRSPSSDTRPMIELDAIERDHAAGGRSRTSPSIDSVTLRVTFDKPLDPQIPLQPALVRIQRADSSHSRSREACNGRLHSIKRAKHRLRDSARRADTDARGRRPAAPPPRRPATTCLRRRRSPRPAAAAAKAQSAAAGSRASLSRSRRPTRSFPARTYRITRRAVGTCVGNSTRRSARTFTVPEAPSRERHDARSPARLDASPSTGGFGAHAAGRPPIRSTE